jgi:hypothetical protein
MELTPTNGFNAAGPVGGLFNVTSQTYSLSNLGAGAQPWGVSNTAAWLNAAPAGGTLAGNTQTSLTISLNAAASRLAAGVYTATVAVTNASGLVAGLPFTLAVGQSLVSNGGFETGNFSGWTLVGDTLTGFGRYQTVYDAVESTSSGYEVVHSGNYGAFLGDDQLATLSQTVATAAGQNYLLSCWLDNPASGSPQQFEVTWNGTTLYNVINPPAFAWTNLQFIVTASGASSVLEFGAENGPDYFGLDDVSVIPISPPGFRAVQQNPGGFNFTWNATPGLAYQIQYSTNLLSTNWINLGAPQVAATNTLALTDTNNPAATPGRFYRIVAQP